MSIDLTGKLYRDMSTGYRDAFTKEEFKKERREQNRKAGEVFGADTFPDGRPIVDPDNLDAYNTAVYGAGAGKGTKRVSGLDANNMVNQLMDEDTSKREARELVMKYIDRIGKTGVITDGGKLRKKLAKWESKMGDENITPEPDDGLTISDPPFNPTPIDPIDDGGDPPFTDVPPFIDIGIGVPDVNPGDFIPGPGTNINQSNNLVQSIIQGNDVNSVVSGNGNTTTINQNNAANNYGGNQYNFARIPGYYS